MPDSPSIVLSRLASYEQFCALENEWNDLAREQVNTIFLTHAWLSQWFLVYGSSYQLWTLTARVDGRLVGIVPLMLSKSRFGFRRFMFMGSGEVTPNHLDVIALPEFRSVVGQALADYLVQSMSACEVLELEKIPADSDLLNILNTTFQRASLKSQIETTARCPYADLPDTFDQFLRSRSKHLRDNLRHSSRYLTTDFDKVSYRCAETQDEVKTAMDTLIHLHQARWTGKGYTGSFSSLQFIQFHHQVAITGLQNHTLRLYYLQIGQEIAAVIYCYRASDTVQFYLSSFDERWSKYSLGSQIIAYAIEQSIAEGARRFDFLEGEEKYKEWWTTGVRENNVFRVYSSSWRSQIASSYTQSAHYLMDWGVRNVPMNVRRPIWQAFERAQAWLRLQTTRQ